MGDGGGDGDDDGDGVYYNDTLTDHISKDVVHHCLKRCRRITHITVGSKSPLLVLKAAFHWSPSQIRSLL